MTLPGTLTTVGDTAFYNCPQLFAAYFEGAAPTVFGSGVFSACKAGFTIYYHDGQAGWTTPLWNGYPVSTY